MVNIGSYVDANNPIAEIVDNNNCIWICMCMKRFTKN